MDEPFAAVDAATEKAIVDILKDMKEQGKTTLVIHHDLQTVPEYFDYVILLNMRIVPTARLERHLLGEPRKNLRWPPDTSR